jgi:hypothetical protein
LGGEHSELIEGELDAMIGRRDLQRRESEGERRERELWGEPVAKYNARKQRELAQLWLDYHVASRRTHRRTFALLDALHAREIERYAALLDDGKESA